MAQIVGPRYPTAPNAYNDIQIYVAFQDELPSTSCSGLADHHFKLDFTVAGIAFQYRIYPQCTESSDMKVLYYTAYHAQRQRTDFAVGPRQLDQFATKVEAYHIAANFFFGVTNTASIHEVNQYRLLQMMMRGDYSTVLKQWGRGWLDALQDPLWWMQASGNVGAGLEMRSAAVAEQEARTLARAAGRDAANLGAGGVRIGELMTPNSLFARIETTGGRVTYRVTGIFAKEGMDQAAAVSARAAHREMIVQAAKIAKQLGQTEFTMVGEQAGPAFIKHAEKLAEAVGPPDALRIVPNSVVPNCEVRIKVDAVLNENGRLLDRAIMPTAVTVAAAGAAATPLSDAQKQ